LPTYVKTLDKNPEKRDSTIQGNTRQGPHASELMNWWKKGRLKNLKYGETNTYMVLYKRKMKINTLELDCQDRISRKMWNPCCK
jgi:hypothetical protein